MAEVHPKTEWRTITPAEAERLLETQLSNRRLNNRRIESQAADIAAGRWVENGETVKLSASGNLMDGQHRLAAIIKAGKSITTLVVSGLPDRVMSTIDQGRTRSSSDVLGLLGVNNASTAASVARCVWEIEKFSILGSRTYPPRSELVKTYRANADLIQDAIAVARPLQKRRILTQTITAMAYILISRRSPRAEEHHWTCVSMDLTASALAIYKFWPPDFISPEGA